LPVEGATRAPVTDCPDRDKIFDAVTKTPVTYLAFEKLLTAWKQPKPDPSDAKPISVTRQISTLKSWETAIQQNISKEFNCIFMKFGAKRKERGAAW
jgi:hypothetical protein